MAPATRPVQYHAFYSDPVIKLHEALEDGRRAAGHAINVDHQYDG
jgi:hypothetical protein